MGQNLNNVKQTEWILRRCLKLIEDYKSKEMEDSDYIRLVYDAGEIYEDSIKNAYCRQILLDVLEAFDREAKAKHEV